MDRADVERQMPTEQETDSNAPHLMLNFAEVFSRKENATGAGIFQRGIYVRRAGRIGCFEFARAANNCVLVEPVASINHRLRQIKTLAAATTNLSCRHS
jgi:hypothetical protein